jgi:putative ABC transport system substrate-binding protein
VRYLVLGGAGGRSFDSWRAPGGPGCGTEQRRGGNSSRSRRTSLAALQQVSRTVPIVFLGIVDPVSAGLVASLARPGGNTTGFTPFEYGMGGKWLELLKQIAPGMTQAAVLRDPSITAGVGQFAAIQSVAPLLGVRVASG